MAAKEFIVAIELGSSKMTGIAGQKNLDGSITVLGVVKEDSSSFIRKGYVYNIDKTAQCLTNIIKKLENQLKTEILQVYVGVGGQSIRSVRNVVAKDLPADTRITQDMVIELMDANRNMKYQDQEILDAAVQEYKVDSQYQLDPVGIQCGHIEGNFLNILQRKAFYKNLNMCFEAAGINVAEMYLAPLALADSVLTETEKRSGCVLVDMGAGTTTVSVYFNNILRHLCVIPLGGSNVTSDITSLKVEAEEAEELKKKYGTAYRSDSEDKTGQKINLSFDRTEDEEKLQEIVEARYEEIIANVYHRISTYKDKLLSGIIVTGGAARIPELPKAFARQTGGDLNVRIAKGLPENVSISYGIQVGEPDRLYTLYALLLAGKENCVCEASEDPVQKTFDFENKEEPKVVEPDNQENLEETDIPDTPEKPKGPSTIKRIWKTFEKMLSDEVDPDEDK